MSKCPWVTFRESPLLNYLFKEEVGKKLEGKRPSWGVMGKEREEHGTGFCCKTKEPVFTGPDSKHTLSLTRLCVCGWLVSGESDALTQLVKAL